MVSESTERFASLKRLRELLPSLSSGQYAAFSALAIERSTPVFEFYFCGTAPRLLRNDLLTELWVIAEGGTVDVGRLTALRDGCEALVERLYDDDAVDYPMDCAKAMSSSMNRWAPLDWDNDVQVAASCQDIVASCGLGDVERWIVDEGSWQVSTATALGMTGKMTRAYADALRTPVGWAKAFLSVNQRD